MTMTDEQRREMLEGLGLSPDGESLSQNTQAVKVEVVQAAPNPADFGITDDDTARRTMPVSDIVFDPALLDGFPNLDGAHMAAASTHVFGIYKSLGRNKDRNGLLHRKITEFIGQVRLSRKTGGVAGGTTEKIKTTKEQRDLAATIAELGLTAEDLAALVQANSNKEECA